MAAANSTSLNPQAEEFKPQESGNLVVSPSSLLPHNIYHPNDQQLPFYMGIPSFHQQSHYFYFFQPRPLHFLRAPKNIHMYHVASQPKQISELKTPTDVGMIKGGHEKRGKRKTLLPPRLRPAARKERTIWKPVTTPKRDGAEGHNKTTAKRQGAEGDNKTTVMIKNIPNQFRREGFMRFLDQYCREYNLEYDFFYLPMDFRTENNVGYAFVNFTTPYAAAKIGKLLKDYRWGVMKSPTGLAFTSKKICEITWAKIQGKDELVNHFWESKFICDTDEFLPVVLSPPRNGSTCITTPKTIGAVAGRPVYSLPLLKRK